MICLTRAEVFDPRDNSRDLRAMKLDLVISTLLGLALSAAAAGCGGGGGFSGDGGGGGKGGAGSGTCGVAPCAGDVVGNWQASSACIDEVALNMDFLTEIMGSCPTASLDVVSLIPSGTVAFAADMTFTDTLVVSSTMNINFPAACIPGVACSMLTEVLQSLVGANGVTSVSCAGSSGCTCTMAQTIDSIDGSGTWSTSGTTLTLTAAAGNQQSAYCVQGASLHMLDLDMSTMMKVVGDIVLTRQ